MKITMRDGTTRNILSIDHLHGFFAGVVLTSIMAISVILLGYWF